MQQILEKAQRINREIAVIKKQITALESYRVHDTVDASYSDWPWTRHRVRIEGQGIITCKRLKILRARHTKKANELAVVKKEVMKCLQNIDPEIKEILILRYVDGLVFNEIASNLGYANESVPRLRLKRFFKEQKINDHKRL